HHLALGDVAELAAQVLRALHHDLALARIGADVLEEPERLTAVASPEPRGERLREARRRLGVEVHEARLVEELPPRLLGGLAVPTGVRVGHLDAEASDLGEDLLAYVQAVGELAAEDADALVLYVGL